MPRGIWPGAIREGCAGVARVGVPLNSGISSDARSPVLGVPRHTVITHVFLERQQKQQLLMGGRQDR